MNVAVIFGGRSCEHNVSIVTGVQAIAAMPKGYKAIPVYIGEDGVWRAGQEYAYIQTYAQKEGKRPGKEVHLRPSSPYLYSKSGKRVARLDAALLCTHGAFGEDGCLQGLLEIARVPYTGSGVEASALGMDKHRQKQAFAALGLPTLPYVAFSADDYVNDSYSTLERIKKTLRFPMIVKPCSLGSSIGIGVAHNNDELFAHIRTALSFDSVVLVENALEPHLEYNCAVLCGAPSEIEQPLGWQDVLTYEDKYLRKSAELKRDFPAKIDPILRDTLRDAAAAAYRAVGADGIARVDFLVQGKEVFVNEINTIPGSLASYFYSGGCAYVIEKLLERAREVFEQKNRRTYSFRPFKNEKVKK